MTNQPQSNDQTTRRLFFAIQPPEAIRANIADFASRLQKAALFTPVRLKWVQAEGFHVTLYFMGDVPAALLEPLREAAAERIARVPSFTLDYRRLGVFPADTSEPPRVLWLGIHRPPPAARLLREACADALREAGLPVPDQDFSPHVTLARFKSTRGLGPFRKQTRDYEFYRAGKGAVGSAHLMESLTGSGPAQYVSIGAFPLKEDTPEGAPGDDPQE